MTKTLKPQSLENEKQLSSKQKNSSGFKYAQDFIDVVDISSGLIFLKDGTISKILEIVPINYSEKSDAEKDAIADLFGTAFKTFPKTGQIKIMDSKANLDSFIDKLRTVSALEFCEQYRDRLEDYINNTVKLQQYNSTKKRFFYIFSYEGDSTGKKTNILDDIYTEMNMQMAHICNEFLSIGNVVINADDDSDYEAEIMYSFFNPKSFKDEGYKQRVNAVQSYTRMLKEKGVEKIAPTVDYIAPRGMSFKKYDTLLMDGTYHTYLTLKDKSFPENCNAEWVRTFLNIMPDCDIDIHYKQLPSATYSFISNRTSVIASAMAINFSGNKQKVEDSLETSNNAEYLTNLLEKGNEDLYVVTLMITLRADSYKELQTKKAMFLKSAKAYSFFFDECFLKTQDFFKMASPFNLIVPEVFNPGRRNMTNSSLASLYCFTSYEMFDSNGFCMGVCANESLFAIDPFDRKLFVNPHIFIAGTSGAGKSFTEMMLASRMRLSGVRTLFVLPLKGHEYRDMIYSLNGSFVTLIPGGKNCINIMEIRPEANSSDVIAYEDDDAEDIGAPLLAKKITSILAFLALLIGEDIPYDVEGLLNVALTNVYNRFGITNDNNSIWQDVAKTRLKKMPIIGDFYDEIKDNPKLDRIRDSLKAWVFGNCSNMNGQTNVDLDNMTLAFNVDEDRINERLLPAFMFIAFDMANSIAKRDVNEKCALIMDEVWKIMIVPSCARLVFKAIKVNRSYSCCCCVATQDIEDCTTNQYGRSIITLSAIQLFLKCNSTEFKQLQQAANLTDDDGLLLTSMTSGQGYFCFNRERVRVMFIASPLEAALYDTDANRKRMRWHEYLDKCSDTGSKLRIWSKLLTPLGITSATYY